MKKWLTALMGGCAAAAFAVCTRATFATVPFAGSVALPDTTWAGSGRLWLLIACAGAGALAALILRRWPLALLFPTLGLGILLDMGMAGWEWRAEKLDELREMSLQSLASSIQYGPGLAALIIGAAFLLAQVVVALASSRSYVPDSRADQKPGP